MLVFWIYCVFNKYCLKTGISSDLWLWCKAVYISHLFCARLHHIRVSLWQYPFITRTTRTPAFWGYPPPPHDYPHYWIPSQKNNRSRTENVTEQTRFSKSRSNDLEDIGQGQRSSHATHLLMLVIICTKYGKNPSRRRYRSRSKVITCDTSSHASDHLYQIWKESIKNCRCYREDTIFKVKAEWPWRYRSRSKVIMCDTSSHAGDHLYQIWKESIKNCRCYREDTIFKVKAEWPWRYRSRSKVIICDTPSHASDHLC